MIETETLLENCPGCSAWPMARAISARIVQCRQPVRAVCLEHVLAISALELSQPRLMFTPSQDSARIGATPLFNFMLLIGLWATLVPRSASSGISLDDNHTQHMLLSELQG